LLLGASCSKEAVVTRQHEFSFPQQSFLPFQSPPPTIIAR
jgi:hypothetical protein